ncbi:MAG: hypothetical protein NZ805_16260, partial [Armatimonadetes bacterium]|nr:hypothetical protein [Armatimonadota bacterium]
MELAEKNPKAPVKVKNGAGWVGEIEAKFLKPLLFSLKESPSVKPNPEMFQHCVFTCALSQEELIRNGYECALRYIKWGAKRQVKLKHSGKVVLLPEAPSVKAHDPWYSLPKQKSPDVIFNRFIGERFVFLEGGDFFVCDVFFVAHLKQKSINRSIFAGLLNTTLVALVTEVLTRKTYGIGVAYLYGPEVRNLLIVCPSLLSQFQITNILNSFNCLSQRPIRSIFEELGFKLCRRSRCDHPEHPYEFVQPETLTLEQVRGASPDRFELDSVVFDVLELTEEERLQVY